MRNWPWPVKFILIPIIIFYILSQPISAATQTNSLFGGLQHAGNQLGVFVGHLGK